LPHQRAAREILVRRFHGGRSPGAPRGDQNGNFTDGYFTAEAIKERGWARSLLATFAKEKPHG
jgi:hypothetical protein